MKLYVRTDEIRQLFDHARSENRWFLFEHEVYELIRLIGGETPLKYVVLDRQERLDPNRLGRIPGDRVVIKVLSPHIIHKSDVGGVQIVDKTPEEVLSAIRRMQYETAEAFCSRLSAMPPHMRPEAFRKLTGEALKQAVSRDITGVLISQYLPVDGSEMGNELLAGLRNTREFGMVITAGMGGTDTELYAAHFKPGKAVVSAATALTDASCFFRQYRRTLSFSKLTGRTRNGIRRVTDEQLMECFAALTALGNHFSPQNPDAPYVIEELEINPFAFYRYLMVPLDGFCRFSSQQPRITRRPVHKIKPLLHPEIIGIIGVSAKADNPGRIILKNILSQGFDRRNILVFHPSADTIEGIPCLQGFRELKAPLDLLILSVGADDATRIMQEIIDRGCARSVIMIPGGLGEVPGSADRADRLDVLIRNSHKTPGGGPLILGGNSLGVRSRPGKYDALFIPEKKLPKSEITPARQSVFISQSGAYMITRMSRMGFFNPAYALSIGNQTDLTAGDLMAYFSEQPDIRTIAVYMEGFRDLDGLAFARSVRTAVDRGKDVLFYKAGRTEEGKSATSGHTASLAGDYTVCCMCMEEAGAMVAHTFTEFEGLARLSEGLCDKQVRGLRLAALSNAGYESVGIADNIIGDHFNLEMADLSGDTRYQIQTSVSQASLSGLVTIRNPLDVTPMATASVYETVTAAMLADSGVDAVIAALVPLTPVIRTLPSSSGKAGSGFSAETGIVKRMSRVAAAGNKPLIMVVDSGTLYDPLAEALQKEGLAVFRSADQAVAVLGRYIRSKLGRCNGFVPPVPEG